MPINDKGRVYNGWEIARRFDIGPVMLSADATDGSVVIDVHDALQVAATIGVHEFYETNLTGANNDISWIARVPGASSLSIEYIDPSANDAVLAVSYATNVITVDLATDGTGTITSTANQIIAAANAVEAVKSRVVPRLKGADTGAGVVTALGAQALSANAGSLTLDVKLQTSFDKTNWLDVAAFAQLATVGSQRQLFGPLAPYANWYINVGGSTPLFAFSILDSRVRWART
jgi:hypothetical protein